MSIRWAFNFNSWLPTYDEMLLATSCLQLEEKHRIAKFVFQKDLKSSLIGRLMIRKFLSRHTDIPYNKIVLTRDDKGKPIFDSNTISFNVSHQGDYTVLAGETNGTQVGVDVMKIGYSGGKSLREFFRIMNRQFSAAEWTNITNSGTETQQLLTFCRNWSLKESYVKALGVGITINLQDISFNIKSNLSIGQVINDTELYVRESKQNWLFEETLLDGSHCVTTALFNNNSSNIPTQFVHLSFNELMAEAKPLLDTDSEYCNSFFQKE